MPVSPEDLVIYLALIAEEKNLQVLVPQNIKCGIITGTSATVGGFCGGPVGVLLGGAFGGTVAALSCKDKCLHVKDLLVSLSHSKRIELFDAFQDVLADELLRSRNYTELSSRIEKDLDLKHEVLRTFKEFLVLKWKFQFLVPQLNEYGSSKKT